MKNVLLVQKKLITISQLKFVLNVLKVMFIMLRRRNVYRKFQFHHQGKLFVWMEKNSTNPQRNVNVLKKNLTLLDMNVLSVSNQLSSTLTSKDVRNVEMDMSIMLMKKNVRSVLKVNHLKIMVNVKHVQMVLSTMKKHLYAFSVEMVVFIMKLWKLVF